MEGERRRMPTIGIWIFAILMVLGPAASIDDKCSACRAVAAEIEHGLSSEKPHNHLDMRHRLDSKGQRKGKVIDYKVSELRVVELLDDLCDKMQEYTLQKSDSGKQEWVKVTDWDSLESDKLEARAHSKAISSYCGRWCGERQLADAFPSLYIWLVFLMVSWLIYFVRVLRWNLGIHPLYETEHRAWRLRREERIWSLMIQP